MGLVVSSHSFLNVSASDMMFPGSRFPDGALVGRAGVMCRKHCGQNVRMTLYHARTLSGDEKRHRNMEGLREILK